MSSDQPTSGPISKRFRLPRIGSTLSWAVLGILLMSLPFLNFQTEIEKFQEAHSRNAWMLLKPFWPAWFAWPQWIFFFWIAYNLFAWTISRSWKRNERSRRLPILSIPLLVLTILGTVAWCAHDSEYLNRFYAPAGSYVREPAMLKSLRQNFQEDDYLVAKYEKMAEEQPKKSKVQGRLWRVPDIITRKFKPFSYEYTGGKYKNAEMRYRLRIPQKLEEGKKYPLLIWLHGVGESGDDNISQLSHMEPLIPFIEGPTQRDFFILATQCPKDNRHWGRSSTTEGKGDAPMTIAMEILGDAIKKYPVDEQAISVFGFSSGGYGVWSMGRAYPGRFAALIPVSCNPHRDMHKYVVNYETSVWTFNYSKDGGVVLPRVQEEIEGIHNKGGTAYMTTFESGGHQVWRNALLETPLIDWLMWVRLDSSPYRVPYWDNTPERSDNDFFMLFIFPLYLSGILLFLGPLVVIGFEKMIELESRSKSYDSSLDRGADEEDAVSVPVTNLDEFRIWTDSTNTQKAELKFLGFEDGKVKFISRDGKSFTMDMISLSQADQLLLRDKIQNI